MKIATWNVNSLKVRLPRVLEFLEQHDPDVLLMQETKCETEAFPGAELAAAGYATAQHSAGRGAGVAIAARDSLGLADPVAGLPGELRDDEARWIEATAGGLRLVSTYVPNGREVGSPTFAEKLSFLDAATVRVAQLRDEAAAPLIVGGDFNVTRADIDVYDPAAFAGSTHVTPEVFAEGIFVDAYRHLHPDAQQFTWWDYRQGHFHRGLGLRIDYLLASDALASTIAACGIARDFRKGSKPSDHAPLVVELEEAP